MIEYVKFISNIFTKYKNYTFYFKQHNTCIKPSFICLYNNFNIISDYLKGHDPIRV